MTIDGMSLSELFKFVQSFHSVEELESAYDCIFETGEVTTKEIRLKQGEYRQVFKVAGEELAPLIHWMKHFCPSGLGRVIDGNQPYDAEVREILGDSIQKLEFGRAIDGYQDQLLNERLTENGSASPNSTFARDVVDGQRKTVVESPRVATTGRAIMEKVAFELSKLAAKKCAKLYPPDVRIVLVTENDFGIGATHLLDELRERASGIVAGHNWGGCMVDVISLKHGLLATHRS